MHITLLVSVLLTSLLLQSCATYRSSFGYAATDLSWLKAGMRREEVVDRLGEPLQFYTLEHGSLAVYEYNQGYIPPMEKEPAARVVGMPFIFFVELATLGGLSYVTVATADCHIAELRILYGTSGNVIAATECPGHPKTESCEDPQSSRRPSTLPVSFKEKDSLQLDCEHPKIIPNDEEEAPYRLEVLQSNSDALLNEYKALLETANQGDPDAQYKVFVLMSDELIEPVAAWDWLCKAADKGYKKAQIEVGYWHRDISWEFANPLRRAWMHKAEIQVNNKIAYLWYTLAADRDPERLRNINNLFSDKLTSQEISEAEKMVKNWKPGQCPTPNR